MKRSSLGEHRLPNRPFTANKTKHKVTVERLSEHASLTRAAEDDAAFDITAAHDGIIEAGARLVVDTGIKLEMPNSVAALVQPRSGLAAKHGITVLNSPGLIDPGYRGEIKVILLNTDRYQAFTFEAGDRIAQIRFVENFTSSVHLSEGAVMDDTERGTGGLGSTGVSS